MKCVQTVLDVRGYLKILGLEISRVHCTLYFQSFSKDHSVPLTLEPEGEEYSYTPCEIEMLGPAAPSQEDITTKGYVELYYLKTGTFLGNVKQSEIMKTKSKF